VLPLQLGNDTMFRSGVFQCGLQESQNGLIRLVIGHRTRPASYQPL